MHRTTAATPPSGRASPPATGWRCAARRSRTTCRRPPARHLRRSGPRRRSPSGSPDAAAARCGSTTPTARARARA